MAVAAGGEGGGVFLKGWGGAVQYNRCSGPCLLCDPLLFVSSFVRGIAVGEGGGACRFVGGRGPQSNYACWV